MRPSNLFRTCATAPLAALLGVLLAASPASAQDCNGDGLPDSQQVGIQGLTAQYFANREWAGTPAAVRVDLGGAGVFDLNNWPLPAGVPEEQFSVRWSGGLVFNQTGAFQFRVTSDDGYRVYLDGVLLGSSNGVVTDQVIPPAPIQVSAGIHYIRVELREDFGGQRMRLERKLSTAATWNIIANSNFRAGVDNDANGVLDLCDAGDCNRNLLPDDLDIAIDPSLDCNLNGILDGCESVAVDCDQNGLPDSCEPSLVGLMGRYYATNDFSGPVVAKRLDATGPLGLDFNVTNETGNDWQPAGVPTDNFSVRWSGALLVPKTGLYDFQMQSDDRATLSIDGQLLFTSNTGNEERGPFLLEAGTRLVVLDLREFGGDQRMRLRWRPTGTPEWSALPGDLYRPAYDGDSDGVADICETGDCNGNLLPDGFELASGLDLDCNSNGTVDSCDIDAGAADCNGNRVLDSCEEAVPGLFGRYYPRLGSSDPADPYRPGALAAVRRDRNIAFAEASWQPVSAPNDELIVIWTGSILTGSEAGVYRFKTESDDGCRVYIDGVAVIDRWLQNAGEGFGQIELAADTAYDFRMEFHDGIGGQYAFLKWKAPSETAKAPYETVPMSAFRMATPDCNGNGVPDDCDIANGTLPDPGSGIPDPCGAAPCTGDLNGDGAVNASDLALLLGAWGGTSADLNADGTVNASDLALLLGNWGACG